MIAAGAVSSVGARNGSSTGEAIPAAGVDCGCLARRSGLIRCESVAETNSTLSQSAAINVFLAARLAWIQSAASSALWS